MKRRYETVSLVEPAEGEAGFHLALDEKLLLSPAKGDFGLPTRDLALAIAKEWQDQGDLVLPASMPMMSFAATAIDRVAPQVEAVAAEITAYAASDLLCYRADRQDDLAERQAAQWDPVIAWVSDRYQVQFEVTAGLMPITQPNVTLMLLGRRVGQLDAFHLAGLHNLTSITGSLILALAVFDGHLTPDEAYTLSILDEDHQAELWGREEEAEERRDRLGLELAQTQQFLDLLGE